MWANLSQNVIIFGSCRWGLRYVRTSLVPSSYMQSILKSYERAIKNWLCESFGQFFINQRRKVCRQNKENAGRHQKDYVFYLFTSVLSFFPVFWVLLLHLFLVFGVLLQWLLLIFGVVLLHLLLVFRGSTSTPVAGFEGSTSTSGFFRVLLLRLLLVFWGYY